MFQIQIKFGSQWQAVGALCHSLTFAQIKARLVARDYHSHAVRVIKVGAQNC